MVPEPEGMEEIETELPAEDATPEPRKRFQDKWGALMKDLVEGINRAQDKENEEMLEETFGTMVLRDGREGLDA